MGETSYADMTRERCLRLPIHEKSPLSKVPNTYLARLFILDDVFYESLPANDAVFNFSDIWSFFRFSPQEIITAQRPSKIQISCFFK